VAVVALRQALGKVAQSSIALSFLAFLLLDTGLRASFSSIHPDRFSSPNHSWAWWAVNDLEKQTRPPEIVLLGSSLMISALLGADATYYKKDCDAVYHHRCDFLESLLKQQARLNVKTASLSVGGQMASDAYALTSTLLRGKMKPKLIVYGIAPRDFIEAKCPDPASTETYRLMCKYGNAKLLTLAGHNSAWDLADASLKQACFIYDKKLDFVEIAQGPMRWLLTTTLGIKTFNATITPPELRRIARYNQPEEAYPREWLTHPFVPKIYSFIDNTGEYRERYLTASKEVLATQCRYFRRFLQYCRESGIEVAVVNMPLTKENVSLLAPGLYDHYLAMIKTMTSEGGARLIDLNQSGLFNHSDYLDTVHLNGTGGEKFFKLLAEKLSNGPELALSKPSVYH
jgi:hypothetical protein